jgi:hypothetical protein
MSKRAGFVAVDPLAAGQAIDELKRHGWSVFELPSNISTKEDFFEALRCTLPLDPSLHGNRSWDALADSLWGGLDGLQDENIALVWPDAARMEAHSPESYAIATSILADLTTLLADVRVTAGPTKAFLVLRID